MNQRRGRQIERAAEGVRTVDVDLALRHPNLVVVHLPRLGLFHTAGIANHQVATEERVVGYVIGHHDRGVDPGRARTWSPSRATGKSDTKAVLRKAAMPLMGERVWDRLVTHPQLWPGGVAALGIVADIEGDRPGPPRKIKGLFRVHGQRGDSTAVVDGVNQMTIADLDVVGGIDESGTATSRQLCRRPVIRRESEVLITRPPGRAPYRGI